MLHFLDTDDELERGIAEFVSAAQSAKATSGDDDFAIGSSIGSVRESNQDRALIVKVQYASPPRTFLLGVVCDGMGGLTGGEEAAVIAISSFVASLLRASKRPMEDRMRAAAVAANAAVYRRFRGNGGSTLS